MSKMSVFKAAKRLYFVSVALLLAAAGCTLFDPFFVPVSFIEGVPETGTAGTPLTLTATVRPVFASNKDIVWSVIEEGTTGADISGNILNTNAEGTVTINALIPNGIAEGNDFTQDFTILITEKDEPPVIPDVYYDVTFESNGGGEIPGQTVAEGGKINKPTDPYKSGYNFGGWYRESALITEWDFAADTVTADITLYAKWIAEYTVTFNANGGNTSASQRVEDGKKAQRPNDPEKAGFGFDNWYADSGLTTVYDFNTPVTGNITLYAKWVELISVINLTVTGPAKNETPDTVAAAHGNVSYNVGAVSWTPADNPFMGVTVYTATVTLTAHTGSKFAETPDAKINGHPVVITGRTDTTITLSHTFDATLPKAVTEIAIDTQPANTTYTHGDTLNLAGLSVELTYDDNSTETFTLANFGDTISASPADGELLSHTDHDGKPVKVSVGNHHADTNNLTVKKAKPTITFPTAGTITYGMTLGESALTGGSSTPSGAFKWHDGTTIPTFTNSGYPVEFTPSDTDKDNYDFTDVTGWNSDTGKVERLVDITVNKKSITITPDSGQSKVYGTDDPTFNYSASPSLIPGDSFSGALGRVTGEDAKTYAFTIGTLSAGNNYNLTLDESVVFTINRADGLPVEKPDITWNAGTSTITVTEVSKPESGQDVEYNISKAGNGTGLGTWQPGLSFTVSSAGTYYVYARSAESTNYNTGTSLSVSTGLTIWSVTFNVNGGSTVATQFVKSGDNAVEPATPNKSGYTFGGWYSKSDFTGEWDFNTTVTASIVLYAKWVVSQGITFVFDPGESPAVVNTGLIIYRSSANDRPATATLTVSSGYTVTWYYNDIQLGTEPSLELNSSDYRYNMIGKKFIRVEALKNGVPYIINVEFEVRP